MSTDWRYQEKIPVELELLEGSKPDPLPVVQASSTSSAKSQPNPLPAHLKDFRWTYVEQFLNSNALSANTRRRYQTVLRDFFAEVKLPLAQVRSVHLARYFDDLSHPPHNKKPSTIQNVMACVLRFFNWLAIAYPDVCPNPPTRGIKRPSVPEEGPKSLTDMQMKIVWEVIERMEPEETANYYRLLIHVLQYGFRASEAVQLNVGSLGLFEDDDGLDRAAIVVQATTTKTKRERIVPISDESYQLICQSLKSREQAGERIDPTSPLLVLQKISKRITYDSIYHCMKRIGYLACLYLLNTWIECQLITDRATLSLKRRYQELLSKQDEEKLEKEVIPKVSSDLRAEMLTFLALHPHQMRHTFATELAKKLSPQHVKDLTGISSDAILKRYTKRVEHIAAMKAYWRAFDS